jgi:hypothetical protein
MEGKDLTHYADNHGIEKNTLVRSEWGNITYQAVELTDTYVWFDNGEKHTHLSLAGSVDGGHLEVLGTRATV